MKIFVTGVCGPRGHNVVNNDVGRGYKVIGSNITEKYSGVVDGSVVVTSPYVQLNITDKAVVAKMIERFKSDAIIHCAAWTVVDVAEV